ncbi:hypothetical protein [Maliponia aquimaris]|uniref:Uncharacterized protein n=1 Tax=Maliponia aquimaris TaxID=1673631 RepID=A0A238K7J7_9RHOB|nr:hypothetical protein [Maliponia aquimaris]SMX38858.1 hypothetical protein MAA8898_01755 [Maliponia aquimaris]
MVADATHPGTIDILLQRVSATDPFAISEVCLKRTGHDIVVRPEVSHPLRDTVVTEVAQMLDDHLAAQQESMVLSRALFGLKLPGLTLTGLRLLTRIRKGGAASATVRFLRSEGEPTAILAPHLRGPGPGGNDLDKTALPVLRDLLCPALEVFDHILAHGLSEADARVLAARLKTMRARRDELSDYIELLTGALRSGADRAPDPWHGRPGDRIELPEPRDTPVRSISWSPSGGTVRGEQASILHGHHARV